MSEMATLGSTATGASTAMGAAAAGMAAVTAGALLMAVGAKYLQKRHQCNHLKEE